MKTYSNLSTPGRDWPRPVSAAVAMLLWALSIAGAETAMEAVRVFTTESACFEYLFTSMVNDANGYPVLSFKHRNGRTFFAKPGDTLGAYRIAAFESKTNRVYHPSLNAYLDEPAGKVTLIGPGNAIVTLEQERPLPWPGLMAWLVHLDNGMWWSIQEQDLFFMGDQPVFVEEIDKDGVTVTAGQDLAFIRLITSEEKNTLTQLWAEKKREEEWEQAVAAMRRQDEAKAQAASGGTSYIIVERGPHVEIRGPTRFFDGTEYRFPSSYKVCPGAYSLNGRLISVPSVIPASFTTRYSGISVTVP